MHSQLAVNVWNNLKFYRRNRLLAILSVFFLFFWAAASIPSLIFISTRDRFEIVQLILRQSASFINFLVPALGILGIHHHLSSRSYKMVITKPCLPDIWLLSHFISAILMACVLYFLAFLVCFVLCVIWSIPFQWGLLYIPVDGVFRSAIILAVLTCLTVLFHPFLAIIMVLLFGESTFYRLVIWSSAGIETSADGLQKGLWTVATYVFKALYMIVPSFEPFSASTKQLYGSLKASPADLKYLALSLAYSAVACALFYFIGNHSLKRKRMI